MADRTPQPGLPSGTEPIIELLVAVRGLGARMEAIEEVLVREKVATRLERVETTVDWIRERLERGGETLDRVPKLEYEITRLQERAATAEADLKVEREKNADHAQRIKTLEDEAASRKWLYRIAISAAVVAVVGAVGSASVWVVRSMTPPAPAAAGAKP